MGLKTRRKKIMKEMVDKVVISSILMTSPVVKTAEEANLVSGSVFMNVDYALIVSTVAAVILGASRLQDMYYKWKDRRKDEEE